MGTKKQLGIAGSIILFIGVFMPIVSIPLMGNMNYFQNGKGDGAIVLVLAGISLILALAEKFKGLWFTGLGVLGIMLFSFTNFLSAISQTKADIDLELAGNPYRGLADVAMQSIQLQWGWAVLIVGAGLIITSAGIKENTTANRKSLEMQQSSVGMRRCPHCTEMIKTEANVCKHCGCDVPPSETAETTHPADKVFLGDGTD